MIFVNYNRYVQWIGPSRPFFIKLVRGIMLSRILTSSLFGVEAYLVEVEVDIAQGLPSFTLVGLPDNAVKESKERVKAAIKNSGYYFPPDRITVNLAPADTKKEGSGFDLAIALGILVALGTLKEEYVEGLLFLGELALDGLLRPVKGALPIAVHALKEPSIKGIVLPLENRDEAAVVKGLKVYPMGSLSQVVEALKGGSKLEHYQPKETTEEFNSQWDVDFSDVKGQESAKRALEIAAAGGHNVLMIGPPGSGKTMLARRLPTILPPLSFEEALETSKIYSVMGMMPKGKGLIVKRPFRSPHHTISDAGLIGGGQIPKPGEVSLAHNGVLFLDELPEFRKNVLEVLRQPMEDGVVTISRAINSITYPASFQLVAAMNPCPCGYLGDKKHQCTCSYLNISRYRSKISGPILDRIDIHVEVPRLEYNELTSEKPGATSKDILERVMMARKIQYDRFKGTNIYTNARMRTRELRKFCILNDRCKDILKGAIEKFSLSARAYARILKIARTIADLQNSQDIKEIHLLEAIQYRSLDRGFIH